jgi:hypothetical protein
MATWTNSDGLEVNFNLDRAKPMKSGSLSAEPKVASFVIDAADLTATGDVDLNAADDNVIPAGAYITKASIVVDTAFTSGGSATLTLGLVEADGTAIDVDGIDVAIALAALGADKAVAADGALVNGTAQVTADGVLRMTVGTAGYTAGKARLYVEYV